MKHLIMFWMLISALILANGAFAKDIVGARIDGARKVMVLTILTSDCNNIMPMVRYNPEKSRENYGIIYDLDFASTQMLCDQHYNPHLVKVEFPLPPRSAGDLVQIQHEDQSFVYMTLDPQEDEVLLAPKGGRTNGSYHPMPQVDFNSNSTR